MNPTPARGRRGPGPLSSGVAIEELLIWMTLAATLLAVIVPSALQLRQSVAVRSAAHETTVAFYRARAYAISRNRNVGLKFRQSAIGWEWALYADGNGNGIRTAEIASGVDPYLGTVYPWNRNDVLPAIMTGTRVPDPAGGGYLGNIQDPIRFNASDICSFSPMGESTPGSVYLWDSHNRMAVVRVYGRTAKIRVLYYRRGERGWTP